MARGAQRGGHGSRGGARGNPGGKSLRDKAPDADDKQSEELRERYVDQTGALPPDEAVLVEDTGGRVVTAPADMDDPAELDGLTSRRGIDDLDELDDFEEIRDVAAGGGPAFDESLTDTGEPVYDTVEAVDAMTPDESFLEGVTGVGGLDGRNDAAGYGGAGTSSPTGEAPDPRSGRSMAGDSLHDINMGKVNKIVNDPSMSDTEKQDALDQLADQIHSVQNGEAGGGGVEGTPPPDTGPPGEGGGDAGGGGGGSGSDVVDWITDALGYDSEKFWGDGGSAGKTSGLTGGLSTSGQEEGLDLGEGESSKTTQKEAEAAANRQIEENEGSDGETAEDDSDEAAAPPSEPPPEEAAGDMTPEQGLEAPDNPALDSFIEDYRTQQTEADLGADVDYGDRVQGAPMDYSPVDVESTVANYEEDYVEAELDVGQATDMLIDAATPDEEFMDADG